VAPRSDLRIALGLLLVIAALGWLTMSGHTYSTDEETVLATSMSLLDRHTFALPEGLPVVGAQKAASGLSYSPFGLLQPVLLTPIYAVSKVLSGKAPEPYSGYASRFLAAMFNPLVHAAIAALIFLSLRRLRLSLAGSIGVALIYAFATWAWPHSRTLFTEPLTTLWLMAGFYALLIARDRKTNAWLPCVLSGIFLALSITTRSPTAILVPFFGLYVLWLFLRPRLNANESAGDGGAPPRLDFSRARLAPIIAWTLGLAIVLLPWMALNSRLFGSPFTTGYGNQAESFFFQTPLYVGLYGLLVSPGKGIIWYAPVLILLFATFPLFWRWARPEALLCLGLFAAETFFHATVIVWYGAGAWGPRYLAIVLPFVLLPLAMLWGDNGWLASAPSASGRWARHLVVWGLIAIGFFVNFAGAAVNFDTWIVSADDDARNFQPYDSAVVAHPRILRERIAEWSPALIQPQGVLLRDGFSYSEGEKGAPLPRWTHGVAHLSYRANAPTTLHLRYADHRPPSLPRATVSLWLNGKRLDSAPRQVGEIDYELTAPVPREADLEIRSDTWNPAALKVNGRDEDIGVRLVSVLMGDGTPAHVSALPQVPLMPSTGFGRWAWFYRPDYHHPVDHWAWYLAASGAPPGLAQRLALAVIVPSVICLFLGIWLLASKRSQRNHVT